MECRIDRAKITVGEDKDLYVDLVDEITGKPFDLSDYVSGTATFFNCNGDTISKALTLPGANPIKGEIIIALEDTDTIQFDEVSKDFNIEIVDNGGKKKIIVMKNKLEIIEPIS